MITHSGGGGPFRIVTHPCNLVETHAQTADVRSHDTADHPSFEILSLSQGSHATPRHIDAGSSTHQAVGRTMSKMLVEDGADCWHDDRALRTVYDLENQLRSVRSIVGWFDGGVTGPNAA